MEGNWLFGGMVVTGALLVIGWFYRLAYDRGYQEAVRWERRANSLRSTGDSDA